MKAGSTAKPSKVTTGSVTVARLVAAKLLPPIAVRMVRIGEETGELARVAGEAGGLFGRQLEKRLETVSGLVGPVAIMAIAGLIGGLMVTIMPALVSVNHVLL